MKSGFDIQQCLTDAAVIEAEVKRLAASLTEAQFHAPSAGGGWSAGYCLEHLVLTGQAYLPKWESALRMAPSGGTTFRYNWLQRRILLHIATPGRLKLRTPEPFIPYSRRPIAETLARYLAMHEEFVQRLIRCQGLDVKGTRIRSPFASWISYCLGFSFDLVLAHERRHLHQAWEVGRQHMQGR